MEKAKKRRMSRKRSKSRLGKDDRDFPDTDKNKIGSENDEVKFLKMQRRIEYFKKRVRPDFSPLKDDSASESPSNRSLEKKWKVHLKP